MKEYFVIRIILLILVFQSYESVQDNLPVIKSLEDFLKVITNLPGDDVTTKLVAQEIFNYMKKNDANIQNLIKKIQSQENSASISNFIIKEFLSGDKILDIFRSFYPLGANIIEKYVIQYYNVLHYYITLNGTAPSNQQLVNSINTLIYKFYNDVNAETNGKFAPMLSYIGGLDLFLVREARYGIVNNLIELFNLSNITRTVEILKQSIFKPYQFGLDIIGLNMSDRNSTFKAMEFLLGDLERFANSSNNNEMTMVIKEIQNYLSIGLKLYNILMKQDMMLLMNFLNTTVKQQLNNYFVQLKSLNVNSTTFDWYEKEVMNFVMNWLFNPIKLGQLHHNPQLSQQFNKEINKITLKLYSDLNGLSNGELAKAISVNGGIEAFLLKGLFGYNLTIDFVANMVNFQFTKAQQDALRVVLPKELYFLSDIYMVNWTNPISLLSFTANFSKGVFHLISNATSSEFVAVFKMINNFFSDTRFQNILLNGDPNKLMNYTFVNLFNSSELKDLLTKIPTSDSALILWYMRFIEDFYNYWLSDNSKLAQLSMNPNMYKSFVDSINNFIEQIIKTINLVTGGELMKQLNLIGGINALKFTGIPYVNFTMELVANWSSNPNEMMKVQIEALKKIVPPQFHFIFQMAQFNISDPNAIVQQIFQNYYKMMNSQLNLTKSELYFILENFNKIFIAPEFPYILMTNNFNELMKLIFTKLWNKAELNALVAKLPAEFINPVQCFTSNGYDLLSEMIFNVSHTSQFQKISINFIPKCSNTLIDLFITYLNVSTNGEFMKQINIFGGKRIFYLKINSWNIISNELYEMIINQTILQKMKTQYQLLTPLEYHFLAEVYITNYTDIESIMKLIRIMLHGQANIPALNQTKEIFERFSQYFNKSHPAYQLMLTNNFMPVFGMVLQDVHGIISPYINQISASIPSDIFSFKIYVNYFYQLMTNLTNPKSGPIQVDLILKDLNSTINLNFKTMLNQLDSVTFGLFSQAFMETYHLNLKTIDNILNPVVLQQFMSIFNDTNKFNELLLKIFVLFKDKSDLYNKLISINDSLNYKFGTYAYYSQMEMTLPYDIASIPGFSSFAMEGVKLMLNDLFLKNKKYLSDTAVMRIINITSIYKQVYVRMDMVAFLPIANLGDAAISINQFIQKLGTIKFEVYNVYKISGEFLMPQIPFTTGNYSDYINKFQNALYSAVHIHNMTYLWYFFDSSFNFTSNNGHLKSIWRIYVYSKAATEPNLFSNRFPEQVIHLLKLMGITIEFKVGSIQKTWELPKTTVTYHKETTLLSTSTTTTLPTTVMPPQFTDAPAKKGEYLYEINTRCSFKRTWKNSYRNRRSPEFEEFSSIIFVELQVSFRKRKMRIITFVIIEFYEGSIQANMKYELASDVKHNSTVIENVVEQSTVQAFPNATVISAVSSNPKEVISPITTVAPKSYTFDEYDKLANGDWKSTVTINLKFTKRNWNSDLESVGTQAYSNLQAEIQVNIKSALKKLNIKFLELIDLKFQEGSIKSTFQITTATSTKIDRSTLQEKIKTGLSSEFQDVTIESITASEPEENIQKFDDWKIALIVIFSLIGIAIIIAVIFVIRYKRNARRAKLQENQSNDSNEDYTINSYNRNNPKGKANNSK